MCLTLCCVASSMLLSPESLGWVLLALFVWQFHHFQKQNFGLIALAASSQKLAGPLRSERWVIRMSGACGILALVGNPAILQLRLYASVGVLRVAAISAYLIVFLAGSVALLVRPSCQRPPSYWAMYLMALLFPLPLFVTSSPYAAVGGMTIAHGLQYLLLMGLVAAGGAPRSRRRHEIRSLCVVSLVGGSILGVTSHLHESSSTLLRGVFGVYLAVLCWHFIADARLWRLSRAFPRSFLGERIPYLVPMGAHQVSRLPIDRLPI